jgi:hypothetical protein
MSIDVQEDRVSGILRVEGNCFDLKTSEGIFALEAYAYSILAYRAEEAEVAQRLLRRAEEAKKAA